MLYNSGDIFYVVVGNGQYIETDFVEDDFVSDDFEENEQDDQFQHCEGGSNSEYRPLIENELLTSIDNEMLAPIENEQESKLIYSVIQVVGVLEDEQIDCAEEDERTVYLCRESVRYFDHPPVESELNMDDFQICFPLVLKENENNESYIFVCNKELHDAELIMKIYNEKQFGSCESDCCESDDCMQCDCDDSIESCDQSNESLDLEECDNIPIG